MDTSQAHLSSKAKEPTKPDNNLSKEELTAVLKYGAQKMYVQRVFNFPFIVLIMAQVRQGRFTTEQEARRNGSRRHSQQSRRP